MIARVCLLYLSLSINGSRFSQKMASQFIQPLIMDFSSKVFFVTLSLCTYLIGLFMVMDGEHALNIAIALLVIYNNFNIFPCKTLPI